MCNTNHFIFPVINVSIMAYMAFNNRNIRILLNMSYALNHLFCFT